MGGRLDWWMDVSNKISKIRNNIPNKIVFTESNLEVNQNEQGNFSQTIKVIQYTAILMQCTCKMNCASNKFVAIFLQVLYDLS